MQAKSVVRKPNGDRIFLSDETLDVGPDIWARSRRLGSGHETGRDLDSVSGDAALCALKFRIQQLLAEPGILNRQPLNRLLTMIVMPCAGGDRRSRVLRCAGSALVDCCSYTFSRSGLQ
jgi:hypothetical protein